MEHATTVALGNKAKRMDEKDKGNRVRFKGRAPDDPETDSRKGAFSTLPHLSLSFFFFFFASYGSFHCPFSSSSSLRKQSFDFQVFLPFFNVFSDLGFVCFGLIRLKLMRFYIAFGFIVLVF